jgi:copper transport protein
MFVVGAALAWVGATAPLADAHASVRWTDPANGELLETPPPQLRLSFTEPPDLELTTVGVVDRTGSAVPTGPVTRAPGANREIRVRLEPLPDGVYTVTWRTVSATDGHVTAGAFSFGVGVAAGDVTPIASTGSETPPPTPASVAGRWMLYLGLLVLLGAGLGGLLAFGEDATTSPRLLGPAWALAAAGVALMIAGERASVGVSLGRLLSSEAGGRLALLAVAVAVAGVAALVAALSRRRIALIVLSAATASALLARALGGHAAGSPVAVLGQWMHLVGVGLWIGGLAWLIVGLRRGLETERVRRYSRLAGIGLLVVVVTGLLRASDELGGPGWWLDAFRNGYRTTLVAKLAVVGALVALGAVNRYRHVARLEEGGPRPLIRLAGAEVALAAAALLLTGILTGLPPRAQAPIASAEREPLMATGSDFATTTRVRLQVAPGTVGPNAFVAEVTDYDTGEAVDARRVSLRFDLPDRPEVSSTLRLEAQDDGTWQGAGTALALDGTWTVTVLVELGDGSVEVPLQITPAPPDQQVEISHVAGQPDLYTFTLQGGAQIQAYVDPGRPGVPNQVHATVFDRSGAELPLRSAALTLTPPEGSPSQAEVLQLTPGHFVSNVDLTQGTWSFEISADAQDGTHLVATWDQTFAP